VDRWLRQVPNIVSSIRILLAVPIAVTLVHHHYVTTLALFGAAAASDVGDGLLAKRFGWQSRLGAVLDPAADKLLLATVFVTLAALRLVPLWLMAAAVARDVIIILGAIAYRVYIGSVEASPSTISKLNTACQAVFILAVIGRAQFDFPDAWVLVLLGASMFVTVVISGIDYVLRYGGEAIAEARERRATTRGRGSKFT
jgi:cardiolipin synthase (CMP-forming)